MKYYLHVHICCGISYFHQHCLSKQGIVTLDNKNKNRNQIPVDKATKVIKTY